MKTPKIIPILLFILFMSSCLPDDDIIPNSDDPRDNIEYTWNCEETSTTYGVQNYMVDISKDLLDSTKVILSNFSLLGNWSSTEASLSGSNITILSQIVEGHSISGQGNISSNYKTINWTYEIEELKKDGNKKAVKESVTALFTRD